MKGPVRPGQRLDRIWGCLFLALVVSALPLLLFHYGDYHWFAGDEWSLLAEQARPGFPDLIEPHGETHWVAVPRLIYLGIWQVFGVNTYLPYQLVVVVMHLAVAVLLRAVMRRSAVPSMLASAAAGVFVLCGPGASNSIWAFQVSFIGSMMWGLAHLLLADHDGSLDRRDLAGLGMGLLAITSSGVGVSTVLAVGVAVLIRRGWQLALVHTGPLAVVYLIWMVGVDATTSGPFGRPTAPALLEWVRESVVGGFVGIGRSTAAAWVLVAVLITGLMVLAGSARRSAAESVGISPAMPVGLAAAAVFFAMTTGIGRAWLGIEEARSDRYVYLQAAFLLPLLAVAASALAKRWRLLTPGLAALFVLPIPFNLANFEEGTLGSAYMAEGRRILTTAVRMPFAADVPPDVAPIPAGFRQDVTIGFLLSAAQDGKLTPSTTPLTPEVVNEFEVRLGVAQLKAQGQPIGCRDVPGPVDLAPAEGDRIQLAGPVSVTTLDGERPTSLPVPFRPTLNGIELTIVLPDLHLRLSPTSGDTISLCADRTIR